MKDLIKKVIKTHINEQNVRWNDDLLRDEALKYSTPKEFSDVNPKAFQAALRRGRDFYDKITSHMTKTPRPIKWTKEIAQQVANKYTQVGEFREKEPALVVTAKKKGWYGDITSHMGKKHNTWDKETVLNIAKKYDNKRDFAQNDYLAYSAAKQNGWFKDATAHMKPLGNLMKREVYAFEFPDNSVYVGLTFSSKKRSGQHLSDNDKTAVSRYIKKTGLTPTLKNITTDFIDATMAQKLEDETIKKYEKNGWTILNVAKAGGLGGGTPKWTKDVIHKIAQKYNNSTDFRKENLNAYLVAKEKGWFDELTSHMSKPKKWTKDEVLSIAKKYNTKNEFIINEPKAFSAARKRGWYDEVTQHMPKNNRWTD